MVFNLKDTESLLKVFFSPDTIIDKVAVWKPDADAEMNMGTKNDGLCHTYLDTIIRCGEDSSYRIVVFVTKDSSIFNTIGWALMFPTDKGYMLESFKRNVYFTDRENVNKNIAVVKFGTNRYAVRIGFGPAGGSSVLYYDCGFEERIFWYLADRETDEEVLKQEAEFIPEI